jgi:hypothetical protein
MTVEIDEKLLEEFETAMLFRGSHPEKSKELCAMEWSALLAGEKQSDKPSCVDETIRAFMISCNDNWTEDDRQLLKPFVVLSLGTASGPTLAGRRGIACLDWTMRVHRSLWLEAAGLKDFATRLRDLPEIVDKAGFDVALAIQNEAIRDARDAWAAWAAWDARDAWAAWAAWAAWDARAAWDAWATWDAWDARDARDAWDAWDARDAWDAWDAWDARDAWATRLFLVAVVEFEKRGFVPETPVEQLKEVAIETWQALAKKTRESELELLGRLIEMGEK